MSYLSTVLRWLPLTLALGCAASSDGDVDADEVAIGPGGKADDIGGLEDGTPEADAILALANDASFDVLDDDVGLDRRAADNIVSDRAEARFTRLRDLDDVPYVGRVAFEKLLAYVLEQGLVERGGQTLRISTFNIRWFGLGGSLFGSSDAETRVDSLRAFIGEHMADRDVLVFQEIVDKPRFFEEVLPEHTCVSYDRGGRHQHIVVCHTDAFEYRRAADDDNYAIEEINLNGRLRPAVHGVLVRTDDDTPLVHLLAVHLKAKEDSTAVRIEQAALLQAHVAALRETSDLPVLIIGDFNTHFAADTGRDDDDEVILDDILHPLARAPLPVTYTYQEKGGKTRRLDHLFASPEVVVDRVESPGPCDLDRTEHLAEIVTHYDTLSDHCPVIVDLTL